MKQVWNCMSKRLFGPPQRSKGVARPHRRGVETTRETMPGHPRSQTPRRGSRSLTVQYLCVDVTRGLF
jgi:hypothetical protein